MTAFPFDEIRRLVAEGRSDEALDIVFDVLDRWMTEGRFGEVDAVLAAVNLDDCDLTVAMGYVTAGSWAREHLPSYAAFVARVRPWMVARVGEMLAAELLAGTG
jgi:hypothetical protein